jgi:syntaxin 8
MPPSASSRLTTTASLILERSRVISLGLTPSPSTDTKIVRALRQVKDELVKRDVEGDGEGTEEEWKRWEGLVGMMREDDVGRRQVAGLDRPERVS